MKAKLNTEPGFAYLKADSEARMANKNGGSSALLILFTTSV
jgi:hypothetical protein